MQQRFKSIRNTGIVIIILLLLLTAVIVYSIQKLDPTTVSPIILVVVGALAGVIGSAITSFISAWERIQDSEERRRVRISDNAFQLTKLEYELRLKALEQQNEQQSVYAPIKAFREIYKALLEFDETGKWPPNINEMGLLNMLTLGPQKVGTPNEETSDKAALEQQHREVQEDLRRMK